MINQNYDERPSRRLPLFSAVIALAVIGLAVFFISNANYDESQKESIESNGDQETLEPFNDIVVNGYYNIELVKSESNYIEVKGSDQDKKSADYKVRKNTLYITDSHRAIADIDIIIGCSEIESIEKTGLGEFEVEVGVLAEETYIENEGLGEFTIKGGTKIMTIINSGSGSFVIRGLAANKLIVTQNGVGEIDLRGKTKRLEIVNSGTGEINAAYLKSEIAIVNNSGIGDVYVNASDSMNLTTRGIGNIYYKGDGKIVETIKGIGKISPLDGDEE